MPAANSRRTAEDTVQPEHPDILVIDDNVGFLRVARAVLRDGDPSFNVHTVETGEDALRYLDRQAQLAGASPLALVVLDFHLPDMDAPEVLARMRVSAAGRLPVLVFSQADWEEDERASLAAGARWFRVKPSDLELIRDIVVASWREAAASPGARAPAGAPE